MRHGENDAVTAVACDPGLTSYGIAQALAAAAACPGRLQHYDFVVSSPMQRAIQTALNTTAYRPVLLLDELSSQTVVSAAKTTCYRRNTTDIEYRYGAAVNTSLLSPTVYPPYPSALESLSAFQARVRTAMQRVLTLIPPDARRVLIVCHGHVISTLTNTGLVPTNAVKVSLLSGARVAC